MFLFSWINIYERTSFPFSPRGMVGGGRFLSISTWPRSTGELCACRRGGGSDGVGLRGVTGRVRWRRNGVGFNGSALHVGNQLIGDLGQYVLSQPGHAQHVVTCAVHVVSERHKLYRKRTGNKYVLYTVIGELFLWCLSDGQIFTTHSA